MPYWLIHTRSFKRQIFHCILLAVKMTCWSSLPWLNVKINVLHKFLYFYTTSLPSALFFFEDYYISSFIWNEGPVKFCKAHVQRPKWHGGLAFHIYLFYSWGSRYTQYTVRVRGLLWTNHLGPWHTLLIPFWRTLFGIQFEHILAYGSHLLTAVFV